MHFFCCIAQNGPQPAGPPPLCRGGFPAATVAGLIYTSLMDPAQRRSRIVIAIFVGAAIVIAIFMISGTFRQLDQQRITVTSGS